MTTQDFINLENRYGADNYSPLDVVLARGKGVHVWDIKGNKYIDCLSGYSALNLGHCHPEVIRAATEQMHQLTLTSRAFRNNQLGRFYKKVCQMSGFEKMLPMNTGAEAVETAIKMARKWGYEKKGIKSERAEIIVCENNFHGRTTTIVGFSSDEKSREGFGPYAGGFTVVPFGDADALRGAITEHTVAVLIEPIQGEAGINIPPEGYLRRVRDLCDQNGILLMLDEIQTGLGRTGKLFAYEHEGIRPDVVMIGKALSGGAYPISAVLADEERMSVFTPGSHGSTFGGNPVAAAIGTAALTALMDEKLIEQAASRGKYLMEGVRAMDSTVIHEVRGRGLLIGIELKETAGGARRYCEKLQDQGLLCKESHETVIRITPPLTITQEEADHILEGLKAVLT